MGSPKPPRPLPPPPPPLGAACALALTLAFAAPAAAQGVVLNEVLPANVGAYPGSGGTFDDYVELYNAGAAGVDLEGYGLSDRRGEPFRHRLPPLTLAPGERYLISAGGPGAAESASQADFGLSSRGETVYLVDAAGAYVDSVAFPALTADVAYARAGDGDAAWGLATPTPEAPNATAVARGYAPALRLAGAPDALAADLAGERPAGLEIRYALDGSAPGEESPRLDGPLAVDATAVARARAFAPDLLPGPVATRTFLADEPTDLPVVALATAPAGLYDPADGIWVAGPDASPDFPFIGANFYSDAEVPAHLSLFDRAADAAAGAPAYAEDVGLRVFGNASRALPQKSSALTARPALGSRDDVLAHAFFPSWPTRGEAFRGVTLRNAGNDFDRAHLRDGFVATLARRTANDVTAYRPVVAYVNGDFHGLQALRERPNEHTAARLAGVDVDDIDLVENRGNLDPLSYPPDNGTLDAYRDLLAFFDRTDFAAPAAFDSLAARFALDNFLDYYATQVYVANEDWPGNNNRLYRVRRVGARWRYLLYDADKAYGYGQKSSWHSSGALARLLDPAGPDFPNPPQATRFFRAAVANPAFRVAFGNRVADLLNFDYRPAAAEAVLDSLAGRIADDVSRHRARWDPAGAWVPWAAELDSMRAFARNRPRTLRTSLRGRLGFGADARLDLSLAGPPGAGAVLVNGYRRVRTAAWTGDYFAGTPITLRAEARPGFTFVGWEGLPAGARVSGATASFDPGALGEATATAVFAADVRPLARVHVNEVNYRSPAERDAGDWVELHNPGAEAVALAGFTLGDDDPAHVYAFASAAVVPPGGYAVVVRDSVGFAAVHPDVAPLVGELGFGLSGDGDVVVLRDTSGRVVDSLRYGTSPPWPVAAAGEGPTLELRRDAPDDPAARDAPGNWQASFVAGGTPGEINSVMPVGVGEVAGADLELVVWPVPAREGVSVRVPGGGGRLVLRDAAGRRVGAWAVGGGDVVAEVPVAGLPAGVYVLTLEGAVGGRGWVVIR